MSRHVHMCISVRGMLNWTKSETKRNLRNIKKNDGTRFTSVEEFRNSLLDELTQGHEVLPMQAPPCEGFDYKHGCPGHENVEEKPKEEVCQSSESCLSQPDGLTRSTSPKL